MFSLQALCHQTSCKQKIVSFNIIYLFVIVAFSLHFFSQPHLSSCFRSCMLLLTHCIGFGFVWLLCDCAHLCVCVYVY